jgi:hypothetical protein
VEKSSQNQRKNIRFQGKCGTCGIKDHTSKDFWTREEKKGKRPTNWKSSSKGKDVIAIESKKTEKIIKYGWVIKNHETTLTDPNIWIPDNGF